MVDEADRVSKDKFTNPVRRFACIKLLEEIIKWNQDREGIYNNRRGIYCLPKEM